MLGTCALPISAHTLVVNYSLVTTTILLALSSCTLVGPDHQAPEMDLPASFSHQGVSWKRTSDPKVYANSRWWKVFGDSTLTSLVNDAEAQNLTIKAAAARLAEARAMSRSARAALLPSLDFRADASRTDMINRFGPGGGGLLMNFYQLPLELSYEVNLWGKVTRQIEGANAREAASQASIAATTLSLTADTAQTYWALRGLDAERAIVKESIALRKETLSLVDARFQAGTVSELDVSRAKTEVATAESELIGMDRQRSELVNALALLTGRAATGFQVAVDASLPSAPRIPAGVPADLLLRRPDIFVVERNVAAANAEIGVAQAAFYPNLRLRASGGVEGIDLSDLISTDNIVWSLGSSLTYPILGQKNLRARRDAAVANHQAVSAEYKQSVLVALRETEDSLKGLDFLARQEDAQNSAVAAAHRTLDLSKERFEAGLVSFLEVVETERTLLATKRLATSLRAQRLAVTVNLIKALGGSW
jgi:multidrug efflux system outer membrane protein